MTQNQIKQRLEYLRGELRAERISWGELAELQSLAPHIEKGDVELMEPAGIPECCAELDTFTRSYIEAALWSSTGEPFGLCAQCNTEDKVLYWDADTREHCLCFECSGDMRDCSPWEPPLDRNYSIEDIAPETLAEMIADCADFQASFGEYIARDLRRAGHDFWLTRNGHGAGFWDGDWSEEYTQLGDYHPSTDVLVKQYRTVGDYLTAMSKPYGSVDLYVGDDGKIYA